MDKQTKRTLVIAAVVVALFIIAITALSQSGVIRPALSQIVNVEVYL